MATNMYKKVTDEIVDNLQQSLSGVADQLKKDNITGAFAVSNFLGATFIFGLGGIRHMTEIITRYADTVDDKVKREAVIYNVEQLHKRNKDRFKEQDVAFKEALKVAKKKLKESK